MSSFDSEHKFIRDRIDAFLRKRVAALRCTKVLKQSISYALFPGGKRLRPIFSVLVGLDLNGKAADLVAPAAAVELVHCYSLVHDDLPEMDDDDFRRGKPTVHRKFDQATAILCGDAMLTLAFEVASACPPCVALLAKTAGAEGMIDGQEIDLFVPQKKWGDFRNLYRKKTGQLLAYSFAAGAVAARAPLQTVEKCSRIGESVGILYQVVDDIRDKASPKNRGRKEEPNLVDALGEKYAMRKARAILGCLNANLVFLPRTRKGVNTLFGELLGVREENGK